MSLRHFVRHDKTVDKQRLQAQRNELPYSNCKAAMLDGKPVTMQAISHGLRLLRDVRAAPPLEMPLCWARRRSGLGVEPT